MRHVLPVTVLLLSAAACNKSEPVVTHTASAAKPSPALAMAVTPTDADDPVLATVNGAPLTMDDVRIALRMKPDDPEPTEEQLTGVLDGIIRREIIAQHAAELGLDKTPRYLNSYAKAAAPLNAFRHRALGEALLQAEIAKLPPITDAEAQKFFDENKETLASDFHVEQVLFRDIVTAQQAHESIKGGKSLADIAGAAIKEVAPNEKPWDLGWQPWQLLPEQWRKPLTTMKPGETSGVITGPKNRFWVIKLVEKRPSKLVDFASAKAGIVQRLTDMRAEEARSHVGDELMGKAKIVRHQHAPKPPKPSEGDD